MPRIHTDSKTWEKRSRGTYNLEMRLEEGKKLGREIEETIEIIDRDEKLMNSHYIEPSKYESEIRKRQEKLYEYDSTIDMQVRSTLEEKLKSVMQRSAELLSDTANLKQYKTANTLGVKNFKLTVTGEISYTSGRRNKEDLSFEDFMPTSDKVKGGGKYYVKAFADLYAKDYNDLKRTYVGELEELLNEDEYMEYLLYQGQFKAINFEDGWDRLDRALLDATVIIPIGEWAIGKDIRTGYDLTSKERIEQGITGGIGLV